MTPEIQTFILKWIASFILIGAYGFIEIAYVPKLNLRWIFIFVWIAYPCVLVILS